MILDYNQEGCLKNDRIDYVKMVLHEFPNYMIGSAKTPAANNLFDVNIECDKLDEKQKSLFVHW
jgi:hypothetical protein